MRAPKGKSSWIHKPVLIWLRLLTLAPQREYDHGQAVFGHMTRYLPAAGGRKDEISRLKAEVTIVWEFRTQRWRRAVYSLTGYSERALYKA